MAWICIFWSMLLESLCSILYDIWIYDCLSYLIILFRWWRWGEHSAMTIWPPFRHTLSNIPKSSMPRWGKFWMESKISMGRSNNLFITGKIGCVTLVWICLVSSAIFLFWLVSNLLTSPTSVSPTCVGLANDVEL